MSKILNVIRYPNSVLKTQAKPVEKVDESILELIENMTTTMYESRGIGLAANQVNVLLRVIVVDVNWKDQEGQIVDKNPIALINPEITKESEDLSIYSEGCLSIPGIYEEIERPSAVTVSFLNKDGKKEEIEADGLLATCLQHEIDHLDGKLFIDHLSRLKRNFVVKKYKKQVNENQQ